MIKNNVSICGNIFGEFEFSHSDHGKKFYKSKIMVNRKSGFSDCIPIIMSEKFADFSKKWDGEQVFIIGQIRSRNTEDRKLDIYLFVLDFMPCANGLHNNEVYLDGYICKQPMYRMTPLGREIADLLLAVNRPYGKSDYLPCICWGRNARFAGKLEVGTHIYLWGRIQSRDYQKRIENDQIETRTAYEVSAERMEVFYENNNG